MYTLYYDCQINSAFVKKYGVKIRLHGSDTDEYYQRGVCVFPEYFSVIVSGIRVKLPNLRGNFVITSGFLNVSSRCYVRGAEM